MTTKTKTPAAAAAAIPLPRIHSTYAGGVLMGVMAGEDGAPDYLLLDLGVEPDKDVTWGEAIAWAKGVGGELPTRRESALLYANARDQIDTDPWYWTATQRAG